MYQAVVNMYAHAPKDTAEILLGRMLTTIQDLNQRKTTAENIAKHLNEYEQHSAHEKGINLEKAKELGLVVHDLSLDKNLEDAVLSIYHAASIAFRTTPLQKVILNNKNASYAIH